MTFYSITVKRDTANPLAPDVQYLTVKAASRAIAVRRVRRTYVTLDWCIVNVQQLED
jgi:hypothetical protein